MQSAFLGVLLILESKRELKDRASDGLNLLLSQRAMVSYA